MVYSLKVAEEDLLTKRIFLRNIQYINFVMLKILYCHTLQKVLLFSL